MTTDDELLDRLRRIAAEVDGPPPVVHDSAVAALATRRIDAELADLIMDSAVTAGEVRSDPGALRMLSFESAAVSVELQLEETGRTRSLRGLVSGATGRVVVQTAAGSSTAEIDEAGWFTVAELPARAFRLLVEASDGTAVATSWVSD